ncbi:hypothetical protein Scep_023731 [Stephania cephalantha]|uniref:Uncharacterized protein n=1 Tax=Stephania cephalantha TaxID=152367 RepID=A0AAP0EW85_9MAGN
MQLICLSSSPTFSNNLVSCLSFLLVSLMCCCFMAYASARMNPLVDIKKKKKKNYEQTTLCFFFVKVNVVGNELKY